MNRIFSKLIIVLLSVFLFSCNKVDAEEKSVFYLEFYDYCDKGAEWIENYLTGIDPSADIRLVTVKNILDFEFGNNKAIRIEVSSKNLDAIKLSIDTFLLKCGPNANFILPSGIRTEDEIRAYIKDNLGVSYDGPIKLKFDKNGQIAVLYTKKLP